MSFSRSSLFIFITFFFCIQLAQGEVGRDPYVYFFNESWGNFQDELAKAKEDGKKGILLFFEHDDCPWCQRMKRTVLNQPEVQEYFRKHLLNFSVKINSNEEVVDFKGEPHTQKDFAEKINRVRATPLIVFYDLEGNQVVRFTGAASSVDEFIWLGEYYLDGHYKNTNFTKYKRQKQKDARQDK